MKSGEIGHKPTRPVIQDENQHWLTFALLCKVPTETLTPETRRAVATTRIRSLLPDCQRSGHAPSSPAGNAGWVGMGDTSARQF